MSVGRRLSRQSRPAIVLAVLLGALAARAADTVTIDSSVYVNKGLQGVGRLPADLRDRFGETFGSGSGLAVDLQSWARTPNGYQGTFFSLPDRGYNVGRTTDYRSRINKLSISFTPRDEAGADFSTPNITATLADTMLLTDPSGAPLTGLDPGENGVRPAANGFPDLPQAANGRVSLDAEGLALLASGEFLVSDEYGPYVYRFSPAGRLLAAIRPPEAFIPKRRGLDHFSSNNPAVGAPEPRPRDPESGRQNNQGFEGLAISPGERLLSVVLQSATRQDGGDAQETRRYTRLLQYDISSLDRPRLVGEYVVPLPFYENADGKRRVAAQSEMLALSDTMFLMLCRDGGGGYGAESAASRYRKIELVDISRATNIAGQYDGPAAVAPHGVLAAGVVPAAVTPFVDINDAAQLARFGLRNGEPNDRNNLSEKWEGMTLAPALDPANPRDFFLFVMNDNDFITQNGYQAGAPYKDASGVEVDSMLLVYRITVP
ncbi:MAG: esterase-like activity of phytase family protein [Hyphomicrobiales bacterium]|nr:esterase-like activity of phytase family protein [Hyphomicrobiales bacterium]